MSTLGEPEADGPDDLRETVVLDRGALTLDDAEWDDAPAAQGRNGVPVPPWEVGAGQPATPQTPSARAPARSTMTTLRAQAPVERTPPREFPTRSLTSGVLGLGPPGSVADVAGDGALDDSVDASPDDPAGQTVDFAPAFDEAELADLEGLGAGLADREVGSVTGLLEPIEEPALLAGPVRHGQTARFGTIVVDRSPPSDDAGDDSDELDADEAGAAGVALVDDTIAEADAASLLRPRAGRSADPMALFEAIKTAGDGLGAADVQLGTRTGRVIASSIAAVTRRDTVAQFSAQALMFGALDEGSDLRFAVLDAGDLHVLVAELDDVRVVTLLFADRPEPAACLDAIRPRVEQWRRQRTP
jgi:hypothetical protein